LLSFSYDGYTIYVKNTEKFGNALRYIAENRKCTARQAVILLYIMDELSVTETGVPLTWLDNTVYKDTPSPMYVLKNLKSDFASYVSVKNNILIPNGGFDDGEFSEYDIEVMRRALNVSADEFLKNSFLWQEAEDYVYFPYAYAEDTIKQANYDSARHSILFSAYSEIQK